MEITDEIPSSREEKEPHSGKNENRDEIPSSFNVEREKEWNKRKQEEIPSGGTDSEWDSIQEVIDSDFLISPETFTQTEKLNWRIHK